MNGSLAQISHECWLKNTMLGRTAYCGSPLLRKIREKTPP
jgi:hypothetical protein